MDRRAAAEIEDLSAEHVRLATGVVLDATHMAAKARWLKRHLPGRAVIAASTSRSPTWSRA